MAIRALFVVSTPAQVATFEAVLRTEAGQKPALVPLFVSLERFYSYKGTDTKLIETGWPFTVLCQDQDYTHFFRSPDWRRIRAVINARRALAVLIQEFAPAVIVLGNDIGAIEKVCIHVSRSHQIPTLLVQDGILSADSVLDYGPQPHSPAGYLRRGYKFLSRWVLSCLGVLPMPHRYGGGGCDLIAASGPYSREVLIQNGAPPERIVITGQPRFDELVELSREPPPDRTDSPGGQKRIILFASFWLSGAYKFVSKEVDLRTMGHLSQVADALHQTHEVWIRPHPGDDPKEYQTALEHLGQDQIQVVSGNLWEQIRCCELMITYSSTAGIEAVALGKPLVTFSPMGDPEAVPCSASGVGVFAGDGTALLSAVKKVLFSDELHSRFPQARRDFLKHYLGDLDGRAAFRVRSLVAELAENGSHGDLFEKFA